MSEVNVEIGDKKPKKKIRIKTGTKGKSLPVIFNKSDHLNDIPPIVSLRKDVTLVFKDGTRQDGEIDELVGFENGKSYSLCYEPQVDGGHLPKTENEIRIYNYISKTSEGDYPEYKVGQPDVTLSFFQGEIPYGETTIKYGEYYVFNPFQS